MRPLRRATIPGSRPLRELGERDDVHLDHRELHVERRLDERSKQAVAGVVDEDVDVHAKRPHAIDQRLHGAGSGQVGGDDVGSNAGGLSFLRQFAQLGLGAGDEHEVVPVFREDSSELEPDAARGAGDQRCRHGCSLSR